MNSKPYGACVETPSATVYGFGIHLKTFTHKKRPEGLLMMKDYFYLCRSKHFPSCFDKLVVLILSHRFL